VAAATEAPERSLVVAMGTVRRRGRRLGAYHAGVGLAALPGGILLGALYAAFGGEWALLLSGGLAVLLLALGAAGRR
jgi:hypothetical protein